MTTKKKTKPAPPDRHSTVDLRLTPEEVDKVDALGKKTGLMYGGRGNRSAILRLALHRLYDQEIGDPGDDRNGK